MSDAPAASGATAREANALPGANVSGAPASEPGPAADGTITSAQDTPVAPPDPNANIVYDVLYDVANLELVSQLKWDVFSTEQRLDRVLREDVALEARAPALRRELTFALETFRANETVADYKERFLQSEERLKLMELVRFLELAVIVREPLHEAWAKYLAFDHDRLVSELATLDVDGLAKRPSVLIQGVRETGARRASAVLAHTERNARQIFREIPYRDWSRVIAWHEEKNPLISNLIADARVVYLHAEMARRGAAVARDLRRVVNVIAAFTAVAALAAMLALFRR